MNTRFATIGIAGALLVALVGPAFAAGTGEVQEQNALINSKVTLSEAIATAEHQTGGKAYDAGADVDHGKPVISVETNGPKGVQTVMIDVQTGQVLSQQPGGQPDQQAGNNEQGGEHEQNGEEAD